jgi:O-antigen/teichoic acid export membrane protein
VQRLARSSGIAALCEGVGLVAEYLAVVAVTRSIGAAAYGVYVAGHTVLVLLVIAGSLGLRQGLVRQLGMYVGSPGQQKQVIWAGLSLSAAVSVVLGVVLWMLSGILGRRAFHMPDLVPLLQVFGIAIPVYSIGNTLVAALAGTNRVASAVLLDRAARTVTGLALTLGLICVGLDLPRLAYRDLVAGFVVLIAAGSLLVRLYTSKLSAGGAYAPVVGQLLRFSLPLVVAEFIYLIMLRVDIIMLASLRSGAEVGVFGAVTRIAWVTMIPLVAIDASSFPALAERFGSGRWEEVHRVYGVSVRWALFLCTPIMVATWVFAKDVLQIFGREFSDGVWALRLVVAGFWLRATLGSVSGIVSMGGHSRLVLYNTLVALLMNVALNFVLVRAWGIQGASIATGGITALSGLAMFVEGRRLFGVTYDWGHYGRSLLAGVLAVAIGLGTQSALEWAPMLVRLLATALAVGVMLWSSSIALKLWHPEDRALMAGVWREIAGEVP